MESNTSSNKLNNSKQVAPQATKVSEAQNRILPGSTVIVTIAEQGTIIKKSNSNAYDKDPKTGKTKKDLICASPYLNDFKIVKNGYMYNGKFHKNLPANLYMCNDVYHPYDTHVCVKKLNLSVETVAYMTSENAIVAPHTKNSWKKLTKINRLKAHVAPIAEGKPFSIDVVN